MNYVTSNVPVEGRKVTIEYEGEEYVLLDIDGVVHVVSGPFRNKISVQMEVAQVYFDDLERMEQEDPS